VIDLNQSKVTIVNSGRLQANDCESIFFVKSLNTSSEICMPPIIDMIEHAEDELKKLYQ
jgi:hypothetical protein